MRWLALSVEVLATARNARQWKRWNLLHSDSKYLPISHVIPCNLLYCWISSFSFSLLPTPGSLDHLQIETDNVQLKQGLQVAYAWTQGRKCCSGFPTPQLPERIWKGTSWCWRGVMVSVWHETFLVCTKPGVLAYLFDIVLLQTTCFKGICGSLTPWVGGADVIWRLYWVTWGMQSSGGSSFQDHLGFVLDGIWPFLAPSCFGTADEGLNQKEDLNLKVLLRWCLTSQNHLVSGSFRCLSGTALSLHVRAFPSPFTLAAFHISGLFH